MNEHAHAPEQSPQDRVYLSLFVLVVALGAALSVGMKVPRGEPIAAAGPTGVVVLRSGQVLRGTVLVRASNLDLVQGGEEQLIPRAQVRYFDTESDTLGPAYLHRFPLSRYPLHDPEQQAEASPTPAQAGRGGLVITNTGDVYEGRLVVEKGRILVRWPYGAKTIRGQVAIPMQDVRWYRTGVSHPTPDYWRKFGDAPIDSRYRRHGGRRAHRSGDEQSRRLPVRSPEEIQAELAQSEGDFREAARRWARVYCREGHPRAALLNLRNCVRNWRNGFDRTGQFDDCVNLLEKAFGPQIARPELKRIVAKTLVVATTLSYRAGRLRSARNFAQELIGLGGSYAKIGKSFRDAIDPAPAPAKHSSGHH